MKGQAWKVWRGTPTTRRHFCSLNGAKKSKDLPLGLRGWIVRHCLVFLSQSIGPVRLAVPVNSEKFDSRRPNEKKKVKNPPRPFGQKKSQNSETQKSPEKEFKTHHKHFKSEISRLGKIFREPRFSRYHSISSRPLCFNCRFPLQTPCTQLAGFLLFLSVPGLWQTWPCNSLLTFLS